MKNKKRKFLFFNSLPYKSNMKLVLRIVQLINFFLSDFGYRIGHMIYCLILCLSRYSFTRTIIFLFVYFLSLEFLVEKYIFTANKRRKLFQDGREIIDEIKNEIQGKIK